MSVVGGLERQEDAVEHAQTECSAIKRCRVEVRMEDRVTSGAE